MGAGSGAVRIRAAAAGIKMMINTPKIYKMRIVFCWLTKPADTTVFNAVRKMVLSSGLPYAPAKINKNWPRFAYGPAPAQGQQAEREYVDIYLQEPCSASKVQQSLQQAAPEGLTLLQVKRVPYPLPSVQNLAAAVRYRVKGDFSSWMDSGRRIESWAKTGKMTVTLHGENAMVYQKDITPFLLEAKTVSPQEVTFTLAQTESQHIAPQWVIAAWWGREIAPQADAFAEEELVFIRKEICWRDSQGELHPI